MSRGDWVSIWLNVPENEVRSLHARAEQHGGILSLDDALSALRAEMTDEIVNVQTLHDHDDGAVLFVVFI